MGLCSEQEEVGCCYLQKPIESLALYLFKEDNVVDRRSDSGRNYSYISPSQLKHT